MITIAGSALQPSQLISAYPANSVERQLVETMSQSTETYRYDTLDQLKFELSLRRQIVDKAKALNRSGLKFEVFHKSVCNPDYWQRTGNGGFVLKNGVEPSAAIEDIFKNGDKYATECATAMVIVYYGALLEVYSKETFNKTFPSIYLMNWHQLPSLLKETGAPRRVADILLGDRCYFRNPQVDPKTPELQGENVIVLQNGLFYGHGIGITSAAEIIKELNDYRREGATQSAYFVEGQAGRPNFKRLAAVQASAQQQSVLYWPPFPPPLRV